MSAIRCGVPIGLGALVLLALPAMGTLRIDEICPQPMTLDANGRESGWVELVNDGDDAVNLADYELHRAPTRFFYRAVLR